MNDQVDDFGDFEATEIESEIPVESEEVTVDESSDFQLDTNMQVNDAVNSLSQSENLRPEVWDGLDLDERVQTLQNVENEMAEIQNRPTLAVEAQQLEDGSFGGYDGEGIRINSDYLAGSDYPVDEHLDTVVHEGRHAFQDYAVNNPGVVSDTGVVDGWRSNFDNYLRAEDYGMEAYLAQPVEADAWDYAGQIRQGLYGGRD